MLRIFSVDSLDGEHIDLVVAENSHFGNYGENISIVDIDECFDDEEIRDIILNDLDESEETKKELLRNYGL